VDSYDTFFPRNVSTCKIIRISKPNSIPKQIYVQQDIPGSHELDSEEYSISEYEAM
jgi:hypothetical protein